MGIKSIVRVSVGSVDVGPGDVRLITTDNLATITAAGYINSNICDVALTTFDIVRAIYSLSGGNGTYEEFTVTISNGVATLNQWTNPGDVLLPVASNNLAMFNGTVGQITDSGIPESEVIINNGTAQSVAATTSSATPGTIRAFKGAMTGTATTMTTGNLVGVRGEVDCKSASGGFLYGVQGKVIPTGTLSGSAWTAGVFGQFDLSAATVNAGQCSAIWGDWGATGATATDLTGCRGVAFTNTTSNVLNAQDYRYGNATYLLELAGAGGTLNYYAAAGTASGSAGNSTHCAAQQVIKVEINGSPVYIPCFTQNT